MTRLGQYIIYIVALAAGMAYMHGEIVLPPHAFVPGDMGDARFNNLVLEHIYQYLFAQRPGEFWTVAWNFFPQANTIAYSDNLIGAFPFYLPWRLLDFSSIDSFQLWLLSCSLSNFFAFAWMMRVFRFNHFEAAVAAFIFAFAMPRGAQLSHPQLLPHAFTPLALGCLAKYYAAQLPKIRFWNFIGFCFFFAWQLWAGVYLGWFFGLGLLLLAILALANRRIRPLVIQRCKTDWRIYLSGALVTAALIIPLAIPYLAIRDEVGGRNWVEVYRYAPGLGGIFLAIRESVFWGFLKYENLRKLGGLGGWHEKQLFQGLITFMAPILLWIWHRRSQGHASKKAEATPFLLYLSGTLLLSLYLCSQYFGNGMSFWYFIYKFVPGANSIRAVGRIIIFMLIPSAILCAIFLRTIRLNIRHGQSIAIVLGLLVIVENAYVRNYYFAKADHQTNADNLSAKITAARQSTGCQAFYGKKPRGQHGYVTQVDAIWVALHSGFPTLNGYSGHWPPHWPLYSVERRGPDDVNEWLSLKNSSLKAEDICIIEDW